MKSVNKIAEGHGVMLEQKRCHKNSVIEKETITTITITWKFSIDTIKIHSAGGVLFLLFHLPLLLLDCHYRYI